MGSDVERIGVHNGGHGSGLYVCDVSGKRQFLLRVSQPIVYMYRLAFSGTYFMERCVFCLNNSQIRARALDLNGSIFY